MKILAKIIHRKMAMKMLAQTREFQNSLCYNYKKGTKCLIDFAELG